MTSCFPSNPSQLYAGGINEDLDSPSNSLLYSLSILKEKVHQVESLLSLLISPGPNRSQPPESTTIAIASMGTLIQEIIVTASSMMFTWQNMDMGSSLPSQNSTDELQNSQVKPSEERGQAFYSGEIHDWYRGSYSNSFNMRDYYGQGNQAVSQRKTLSEPVLLESEVNVSDKINEAGKRDLPRRGEKHDGSSTNYDIIELDAADLLAKYTHYCHVCGKGFKRDANLRMHMRAHGDEYKSRAALSNPMKNISDQDESSKDGAMNSRKKYSCPQEGCRWNRKHAKFQPLKSMICVKNHYKRSHCPKMYVCKRCNRKQFSVLSDLRTHEKHCGDLKWQCSCGTTFTRKDKLMGHVALFVGHHPATTTMTKKTRNVEQHVQVLLM